MNNLSCKKKFFMKEIFFSFTKDFFFSFRKSIFSFNFSNLTAEANTIKWRYASAKASAFADCRGEFRTLLGLSTQPLNWAHSDFLVGLHLKSDEYR